MAHNAGIGRILKVKRELTSNLPAVEYYPVCLSDNHR